MRNSALAEDYVARFLVEPRRGAAERTVSASSPFVIGVTGHRNLLVASVTALLLGAWKLHQSKMAKRELIWQYTNQLARFSRSSAELERTATPARRTEVLVELGKRSLMEGYLWTIHRYHREHAPPGGG